MDKNKKFIYGITCIYISLFAVLIFYVVYFTAIKQKQISVHPNNTRLNNLEQEVIRGNIYDTNMKLLATTTDEKRVYPKGSLYAHVVGYAQRGKTGVEALANTELLYPDYNIVSLFKNAFLNEKFEGRDIVLTLDDRYQEAVAQAMKGKKGGVIVIEPTTGKIKAMYANPGFNPNNINEDWETLSKDTKNSPLINRATNGLYPPGSTFKMITALAYLNQANASASGCSIDASVRFIQSLEKEFGIDLLDKMNVAFYNGEFIAHKSLSDFFGPVIKTTSTAYPEQYFRLLSHVHILCHRWYFYRFAHKVFFNL